MSFKTQKVENENSLEYDVEIFDLCKDYILKGRGRKITALSNINLKAYRGEILGLLGPNGAGKTTMVSILTTLAQPTSGTVEVLGHNVVKEPWIIKRIAGVMFGSEMIYHRLTGYRNLKYYCKLYEISNYKEKIIEIAEKLNIVQWLNQFVDMYSRGMKLKLALARVLLINPKILFLDEPMLGLDPNTIREVMDILLNLNITIFLTSHQMRVVEKLCDRIIFLDKGRILKIDTKENIKKYLSSKINYRVKVLERETEVINQLKDRGFVTDLETIEGNIIFSIDNNHYLPEIFQILKGYKIESFSEIEPSLEELFMKLNY
ncbi:MAG: ATP-binding cassette domain-containing protein [Candidatus Thorarchaeota archaeon]